MKLNATPNFDLAQFLKNLTSQAGIYQMLDVKGDVLYVGKAKNLKKRVTSYFRKNVDSTKTRMLVSNIARIEVIITHNETEALLLENTLIKQHLPRFNILLRDDKSYPYLYISTKDKFPRLDSHRGPRKAPGEYYGPYPSASAVRENLQLLQKIFKLRNCSNVYFQHRTRPCLQYQIGRCTAPCVGYISRSAYAEDIRNVQAFLAGKSKEVIENLAKKMDAASKTQNYELAAKFRNQIVNMRKLQEQQDVISTKDGNVDIVVLTSMHSITGVLVMMIRTGRLLGSKMFFPKIPADSENAEIFSAFLSQYYLNAERGHDLPNKIITNEKVVDGENLAQAFSSFAGHKVSILQKVRGERARWLESAITNAQHRLSLHASTKISILKRFMDLQKILNLKNLPKRIECFDISHSGGEATVASCVVFNEEGPVKNDYRRFNISGITEGDDYAAMRQALTRRFHALAKNQEKKPDILLIDGGKGQLRQAEEVLAELAIDDIIIIGVAKGKERIAGMEKLWQSGASTPLDLDPHSMAFHLIQQVRDEAHRFAITGHRAKRKKTRTSSELEKIPGVGPSRRRELLRHLGGWQEIKKASVDELAKIPGISRSLAQKIYDKLH